MEKLGDSRYIHLGYDLWICPYDLCWTIGPNASGNFQWHITLSIPKLDLVVFIGIGSASEMFC
jgi:hypothetical protein